MGFRHVIVSLALLACASLLPGCSDEQPVEVYLPPQGDAVRGKAVFVKYDCQACHTIPDVDLPGAAPLDQAIMPLGVRVHRVRDYGDLLTAVIYPQHVVSPKYLAALKATGRADEAIRMPDFTQRMTVAELVDVVEFLHAQYSALLSQHYQGKGGPPRRRLPRSQDD